MNDIANAHIYIYETILSQKKRENNKGGDKNNTKKQHKEKGDTHFNKKNRL